MSVSTRGARRGPPLCVAGCPFSLREPEACAAFESDALGLLVFPALDPQTQGFAPPHLPLLVPSFVLFLPSMGPAPHPKLLFAQLVT